MVLFLNEDITLTIVHKQTIFKHCDTMRNCSKRAQRFQLYLIITVLSFPYLFTICVQAVFFMFIVFGKDRLIFEIKLH